MRFTLYPIYGLAASWDDEPFNRNTLPFPIMEGVSLEAVADKFREGSFALWQRMLGTSTLERLEDVCYALVHRYDPAPITADGVVIGQEMHSRESDERLHQLAACLRLIRPMRQRALLMRGVVRDEDGTFDVTGFDMPANPFHEVPEVQKLFDIRNRDASDLRLYAPEFLYAIRADSGYWKFRMAVQFHDLGHFAADWKARYLLWCSAIESIYTSHNRDHQGALVATSRIKWFLGERTSVYAPGDLPTFLPDPGITIEDVVGDLYTVRNLMAHGDRIPDEFFNENARDGLNGGVIRIEVLLEAASFIIRTSLLKILRERLLPHFTGADAADAFFGEQGLTNTALRALRA